MSLTGAAQLRASGNSSCLLLAATQPVVTIYDSRPKTEALTKIRVWDGLQILIFMFCYSVNKTNK